MAGSKKSFVLRIDPELWDHLNQWATDELRSVNGQIEYILRDAVRKRTGQIKPQEDSSNTQDES